MGPRQRQHHRRHHGGGAQRHLRQRRGRHHHRQRRRHIGQRDRGQLRRHRRDRQLARLNGQYGGVWFLGASANTLGGTTPGAGNVISGNPGGIYLSDGTTGVQIEGNYIGVNANGTAAVGNVNFGVLIGGPSGAAGPGTGGSADNTIGGTAAGAGNLIVFNGAAEVAVVGATTTGNSIEGNSIYGNAGLGIDLGDDGVTPNAPGLRSGPNNLENYPVLNEAFGGTATSISGTLNSLPNTTVVLDFYTSPSADPSGYGQGQNYLGSTVVSTDNSGNATFDINLPTATNPGAVVTATATDTSGNTSEFAADVTASSLSSSPPAVPTPLRKAMA